MPFSTYVFLIGTLLKRLKEMKRLPRPTRCLTGPESGQATIEYILVVVIVLIIALTLLYRFHGGFKKYTEAFFDGYIACLLETGELPGTGSQCQGELQAFDSKNGKNLLKDNLPTNNGNWGKGAGGKNAGKSGNSGKNGAAGGEVVSGGADRSVGNLGRSGRQAVTPMRMAGSGEGEGGAKDSSGLGLLGGLPVARMQNSRRPHSVQMSFTINGTIEETTASSKPVKKGTGKTVEKGGSELRPVKSAENMDVRRTQASIQDDREFSIGGLVRLVIIILIIIAMVIFFGGQLLQVLRSRDKGGGGD